MTSDTNTTSVSVVLSPTESAELYKRIMAQFAREVVARSFEARKRRVS